MNCCTIGCPLELGLYDVYKFLIHYQLFKLVSTKLVDLIHNSIHDFPYQSICRDIKGSMFCISVKIIFIRKCYLHFNEDNFSVSIN